jgi:hypothetical protein
VVDAADGAARRGGDQLTNQEPNTTGEEQVVMRPTIPVVLFSTADVIARGLPDPARVEVTVRFGLTVDLGTHADLREWARRFGLAVQPWHSQPYVRDDGAVCQLTNVAGRWRGVPVHLHCCEPVESMAGLPDQPLP